MPPAMPLLVDNPRPLLFAHRGLNQRFLENTIEAFAAARHAGVPGIELDVHLTLDRALVVFHDDDTGRIDAQSGGLSSTAAPAGLMLETSRLEELRSTLAGRRMPLLDEIFEEFGTAFYYDIELKSKSAADTGLAAAVADCIRRHGLSSRCIVSSFNPFILRHFRKAEPAVPVGIIWSRSEELYWFLRHGEGALIGGADFLKPEWKLMEHLPLWMMFFPRLRTLPLIPWTVNNPSVALHLAARGAEGIISDAADMLLSSLMQARDTAPLT